MKFFEVEYMANGRRQKMTLKANNRSEAQALAKTKKAGVIVKVGETKSTPLEEQFADMISKVSVLLGGSKIKINNLIAAFRQLSVMTNAGISIHDSIKEVSKSTEDKRLKAIFATLNDDLNQGQSLTDAITKFKGELGDVVIAMVKLGESTGNMSESLHKLSDILQEVWENQRKFKKALRYPIIVMSAMAIAFIILMIFVVPQFREIFEQLGAKLPLPTIILLSIESALSNYGLYILVGFIATIYAIRYLYKRNDDFKYKFDKFMLKVYLINKIIFYSTMNRFNLIFTELVRAGIPIADALETATLTVENQDIHDKLATIKIAVQRGVSLTEAFRDTQLYESMLIQMLSAGEKGGAIDTMLEKVTDYYKAKFSDLVDNISSYVEPIMLLFMAGMVILLALGIFMPMWDLGNAVQGR
ncbi:transformation system, type II secretion system membrane protein CtsF [Campylobacter showae]|uniref:Bacterial type II secretion system domain protein F n=1 Tax=Campylobacter showae RM3277 TaxID=553219 RepID=C6REZ3_9BACT|nr:type II secretion system F family protein [Campylobacter showae]EET79801.1 bacterial type II secretion system domain protein F [Campylobacter showae RM3277]QCD48975.1 transformation system, type II secretion system membrane protein CtsF [Campylobacter showae]